MITEVLFLSVESFKHVTPAKNIAVVSMLDRSEEKERPDLSGFRESVVFDFEDTFEELEKASPGDWPDFPTDEDHALLASKGERICSLKDAQQIVALIRKMHSDPEPIVLIAHCHGGISRSAAVGLWAAIRFHIPITSNGSTESSNPRLLRLLNKADGWH